MRGTLEWMQETPNRLGTLPLAAHASRIVKGGPEGFHEGFSNLYSDAAEAIAARRAGVTPDPLALHFPTADDSYRGVAFLEAAIASSDANGA